MFDIQVSYTGNLVINQGIQENNYTSTVVEFIKYEVQKRITKTNKKMNFGISYLLSITEHVWTYEVVDFENPDYLICRDCF